MRRSVRWHSLPAIAVALVKLYRRLLVAMVVGLFTHATNVAATLITFDDYPAVPQGNGAADSVSDITSGGYDFTAVLGNFLIVVNPSLCAGISNGCVDNGTHYAALRDATLGGPVVMSKHGGGTFSLVSFDGAENFLNKTIASRNAFSIAVVGHQANGGTLFAQFGLDNIMDGSGGVPDFQQFFFGSDWTDLVSVQFSGERSAFIPANGNAAIDNIEAVASVPEPATLLMLGCGLAALGWSRRKR